MRHPIANFLAFQLGWLVAVGGAGQGLPWAGVAYAALFLPWHLLVVADRRGVEAALLAGALEARPGRSTIAAREVGLGSGGGGP